MRKKIGNVLFALVVAGSLGYGASQAVASPAESDPIYCTTWEERNDCYNQCNVPGYWADCSHTYGCTCQPDRAGT